MMGNNITYGESLRQAAHTLASHGIEGPLRDARRLMEYATGLSSVELISDENTLIAEGVLRVFDEFVQRRCLGEPVSKISGKREFWGQEFKVTRDVLDPRADTETLVELVLDNWREDFQNVLDLGTGSGCILLSILSERKLAFGVGLDQSRAALDIASFNAKKMGLDNRAIFTCSNWFDGLGEDQKFDVIVSNPPYIPTKEIESLDRDVRHFDPMSALDGGTDGLDDYRRIILNAGSFLKQNGLLAFEVGYDQADDVSSLLKKAGFLDINIRLDLAGVKRCVYAWAASV